MRTGSHRTSGMADRTRLVSGQFRSRLTTLPNGSTAAQDWNSIGGIMQFDIDKMAAADRYELLLGTVVPRPIALVTTISSDGAINAAPYSLFNVMGHDPAVAMISALAHPDGRLKDTATNILATKEFVINLVSEAVAWAERVCQK
jgi:flavin reductase (DIM6/NTAB) family NADH-FMN oxidoreductase RutF